MPIGSWLVSTVIEPLSRRRAQLVIEGVQFFGAIFIGIVLSISRIPDWLVWPSLALLLTMFVLNYAIDRYTVMSHRDRRVSEFKKMLDVVEYERIEDELERAQAYLKLLDRYLSYDGQRLRFTYHHPVEDGLEQAFEYIPTGDGNAGSVFPRDEGIIGKGYERKRQLVFNCDSVADCVPKLQRMFGYSLSEAEYHSSQRRKRSYFCHPIIDEPSNDVLGIIYFESTKTGAFPQTDDDILPAENITDENMQKIIATCDAIDSSLS